MQRVYKVEVQTTAPDDKLPRVDGRLAAEIDLHFGAGRSTLFVLSDEGDWVPVTPIDSSH